MARKRRTSGSKEATAENIPDIAEVPKRRNCGTMQVHMWLLDTHPEFRVRQSELERVTTQRLRQGMAAFRRITPYRIPVVVHVVHNLASENISDAQVKSQIDALNRDYRLKNADKSNIPDVFKGLATDVNIEFFLATKDPAGLATNGITRTKTTQTDFDDDNGVKSKSTGGANAWPTDRYLNIWCCSLRGGLLGYAQFPGGPPDTDGVVILNTAFGTNGTAAAPFNVGRTAVHEVGHFLNLRHIWGDTEDCTGSDFVADTPPAQSPNFNNPTFPHVSCSNGPS